MHWLGLLDLPLQFMLHICGVLCVVAFRLLSHKVSLYISLRISYNRLPSFCHAGSQRLFFILIQKQKTASKLPLQN
jgi:hypothetical protein